MIAPNHARGVVLPRLALMFVLAPVFAPIPARPAPAARMPVPTIAVLPIKLLDTSGEPADQGAAHRRRLEAMAAGLSSDLGAAGLYRTVAVSPEDVARHCPSETADCLLAAARARQAGLVFVGVVHKSSTLIMQMWARIVDVRSGETLFSRELNFRGDNDEAWRRAEAFLADQIGAAPPQPRGE